MAWQQVPGLNGRVYVPDNPLGVPRKYPCVDCFSCQFCSDERCSVCRGGVGRGAKDISKCLKCRTESV